LLPKERKSVKKMRFCKEQKQIEVVLTKKKKKLLFCKQKKDKTKRFASRISSQLLQKNPYPFFLVNLRNKLR
jgi:hypothetical protein